MKLGFFFENGSINGFHGIVKENHVIRINNYIERVRSVEYPIDELIVSTPVIPAKIVAVGLNYKNACR